MTIIKFCFGTTGDYDPKTKVKEMVSEFEFLWLWIDEKTGSFKEDINRV